jgi:hypothetical protein
MSSYSISSVSEVVHIVPAIITFVLHIKVGCFSSNGREDERFILKKFTSPLTRCLWNVTLNISMTAQIKKSLFLENNIL